MESIIITVSFLLLVINFFGINIDAENFIPKANAIDKNSFAYHLKPANRVNFPYRLKGVPQYNASALSAKSAVIIDEDTGRVLFEKDSYDKRSIASITKLMSVLVWWEVDGDLEKTIEIKPEDYREGGVSYFVSGERVKAKDLLRAGLIASSNSAIAALVRSTGLKSQEFVELMNEKADNLGMKNTRFKEPTGLDFKNISTAIDLFILAREAFKNPILKEITQIETYKFRPIGKSSFRTLRNTNWLLSDFKDDKNYKIEGGKTGYLDESGYNLVLKIKNYKKNKNLIIVILGSIDKGSRFLEAKALMEWSYNSYIWES